jgi:AhpD family alkylhydroperoxidase
MRLDYDKLAPDATKALWQLSAAVQKSSLDAGLREMVAVYVSLKNRCAYCIATHWKKALAAQVPERKLRLLPAYRETEQYTKLETIALDLADELTGLERGVPDHLWETAIEAMGGEEKVMHLVYEIIVMNSWNRLSIALNLEPPE